MEMKLTPRFYQNGERVFGPGVAELLKRVQEHHSLRAAAFSMEMAYSKAWQIIRTAGGRLWLQASQLHDRRPPRRRRSADAGGRTAS